VLLDVNGVGYEIEVPMTTLFSLPGVNETAVLHTHLLVREDATLLYGFATQREKKLFRQLLKVNGVGAKMALTILSGMPFEDFIRCVNDDDVASLVRLPGVGKKTAERLIIEMRDRLKDFAEEQTVSASAGSATAVVGATKDDPVADAVSALVALGYKANEASRMVRAVDTANLNSEEIIKRALQQTLAKT
jgi:Holliday junction DNA helicase RuvA